MSPGSRQLPSFRVIRAPATHSCRISQCRVYPTWCGLYPWPPPLLSSCPPGAVGGRSRPSVPFLAPPGRWATFRGAVCCRRNSLLSQRRSPSGLRRDRPYTPGVIPFRRTCPSFLFPPGMKGRVGEQGDRGRRDSRPKPLPRKGCISAPGRFRRPAGGVPFVYQRAVAARTVGSAPSGVPRRRLTGGLLDPFARVVQPAKASRPTRR